jgi:hypothetical protein
MSTATSTSTGASPKAQGSQHGRQGSQGPRVSNGNTGSARKAQNGGQKSEFKSDAGRRSPQGTANGQQGKKTQHVKAKSSSTMSDYLRQRGATVEVANAVGQIRSDLGGYYSEELVYNTFVSNGNNAEATRAALTRTYSSSWYCSSLFFSNMVHPRGTLPCGNELLKFSLPLSPPPPP